MPPFPSDTHLRYFQKSGVDQFFCCGCFNERSLFDQKYSKIIWGFFSFFLQFNITILSFNIYILQNVPVMTKLSSY